MSDIKPIPEFISYKKLKNFLSNAIEESEPINKSEGKDTFNEFLQNWCKTSEELIKELRKKDNYILNNKDSKSLLALGAMEAHINMAIQALKAYESEQ